ncbi:tetratricopeptide repeat protein [Sphingobacterium prati]|uniref:tetratricopeptide repeat protein n=1 Tax=Sphingobacterium prati TaxID=2737006 RepID=UPI0015557991|nr:tetratricopeptide repeat protein [Sphingobacterium prati]NPE45323.1 tetratricopeptide repeat protein [Sphingobacterium prati]
MKSIITVIICLISSTTFAQSNYEKSMGQAMSLWRSGEIQKASALLERISQAEKDNWIPAYYQAMILTAAAFREKDKEAQMRYIQSAETILNNGLQENNSEWLVLKAMNTTALMVTDPMTKAKELSPVIISLYKKALAITPNNPRAVLGLAEFQMNAKKYFNQDSSKECEDVKKAVSLFNEEKVTVPFSPSWGKDRAEQILKVCK